MDLSKDDVLKILKIIEESSYDEVRLEVGDFKLHVQKRGAAPASTPLPPTDTAVRTSLTAAEPTSAESPVGASVASQQPEQEALQEGLVAVRAPMLGTFYRAPSPGEKPFVEVGDEVGPDTIVCLVEVMKLFNSVKAGVAGRIVKIPAENATMVEYGQPLLLIEHDLIAAPGDE